MVHFVGAGPGAPDLITLRGDRLIREADVVIYAGSLVNPALLEGRKADCAVYNSAEMTLTQVFQVMCQAEAEGKTTVRLHTGDPSLYGAVREQMDLLETAGIAYDSTPGVSSLFAAAASLNLEYTLPGQSQSVIITRMEGRTSVPEAEGIESFASHRAAMVIFLSAGMTDQLAARLLAGGYGEDTPAAIVYKASWPEEKRFLCTVGTLADTARDKGITRTALILVGDVVAQKDYTRSRLYAAEFETAYRKATGAEGNPVPPRRENKE